MMIMMGRHHKKDKRLGVHMLLRTESYIAFPTSRFDAHTDIQSTVHIDICDRRALSSLVFRSFRPSIVESALQTPSLLYDTPCKMLWDGRAIKHLGLLRVSRPILAFT